MKKKVALSPRGAAIQGALIAYLQPKLAMDSKVDLTPVVAGVTAKNWKRTRSNLIAKVLQATNGKLAMDADISDIVDLIDAVGGAPEEADVGADSPNDMTDDPETKMNQDPEDTDEALLMGKDDMEGQVRQHCAGKMSPEDIEALLKLIKPDNKMPSMKPAIDKKMGKDEDEDMPVTKPAMDAAIKAAVTANTKKLVALREAENFVRPWIGEIDTLAMDSADSVYKLALDANGIDVKGVHPSAYRAMLNMVAKPGATPAPRSTIAMDSKASAGFFERYPGAQRMRVIG